MKKEIWEDIKDFEGLYQVSNYGNIKSLPKNHRYGSKSEKILKPKSDKQGYLVVDLSKFGKVKRYRIHRLVAQEFIPNPDNKPTVNHINGIKNDNNLNNLQWATYSEQNIHLWNNGLRKVSDEWVNKMKKINTGRNHTEKTKKHLSKKFREQYKNGRVSWNKGKKLEPLSEETKQKISISVKKSKSI